MLPDIYFSLLADQMSQKKGSVYFKLCRVANGGADGWSTDAPRPWLRGRGQLTNSIGQIQAAGRGGGEVVDGMSVVSTQCDAVLDASEKKWFPGVEPLP